MCIRDRLTCTLFAFASAPNPSSIHAARRSAVAQCSGVHPCISHRHKLPKGDTNSVHGNDLFASQHRCNVQQCTASHQKEIKCLPQHLQLVHQHHGIAACPPRQSSPLGQRNARGSNPAPNKYDQCKSASKPVINGLWYCIEDA